MRGRYNSSGGLSIPNKVFGKRISTNLFDGGITHHNYGSVVTLDDGRSIKCKVLVDATGPKAKFVETETPWFSRSSDKNVPK